VVQSPLRAGSELDGNGGAVAWRDRNGDVGAAAESERDGNEGTSVGSKRANDGGGTIGSKRIDGGGNSEGSKRIDDGGVAGGSERVEDGGAAKRRKRVNDGGAAGGNKRVDDEGAFERSKRVDDGGAAVGSELTGDGGAYGEGDGAEERERAKKNEKHAEEYRKGTQAHFLSFVAAAAATGGRLGGQGRAMLDRLSVIISRYTGQERSTIQYHWGAHLIVPLAKYQHSSVSIHAEAQSRQQDTWGDQSYEKHAEQYENLPSRENLFLVEQVL